MGFPKLMVSTMASGDIAPYIGEADITMMYGVVSIAGINSTLTQILNHAAGCIIGMTLAREDHNMNDRPTTTKRLAISMLGSLLTTFENKSLHRLEIQVNSKSMSFMQQDLVVELWNLSKKDKSMLLSISPRLKLQMSFVVVFSQLVHTD